MNVKRYIRRTLFCILLPILLFVSCKDPAVNNGTNVEIARTGKVTFKNVSSYKINVRLGRFSGIMLVELLNTGSEKTENVRVSDDHGLGTTFAIEYLFRVNDLLELFDPVYGDIYAIVEDFEMQPNLIIEEGRSYTVQIPNPNPETRIVRGSHLAIINTHNQPVDFRNLGGALRQTNNNIPIQPYTTGVYKIEHIPQSGMRLQGHYIRQGSVTTPFLELDMKNGFVYQYIFDGTMVKEYKPPQSIMF